MDIIEYIENRTGKDCTLQDLADILEVSYSTIKRYGRTGLTPEQIVTVVRAYGMNPVDALEQNETVTKDEIATAESAGRLSAFTDTELAQEILDRAIDAENALHLPINEVLDDEKVIQFPVTAEMSDRSATIRAAKKRDGRRESVESANSLEP